MRGKPVEVFLGLGVHPAEGGTLLFSLDDADGLPLHEEHIVGKPSLKRKLPDSNAPRSREVQALHVLNTPTGKFEHSIDVVPCPWFRCSQDPSAPEVQNPN